MCFARYRASGFQKQHDRGLLTDLYGERITRANPIVSLQAQHKGLNEFLNTMVVQTDPRNPNARGRVQVQYKHRREIDKFYELPNALQARLPGCVRSLLGNRRSIKVRVTYDQKTQQVLAKIVKARVADIHLHLPTCPLDCRLSINLEMAWDGSVEELESVSVGHADKFPDRNKDRLSYKQNHYQIDLTQVTQMMPGPGVSERLLGFVVHELC